MANTIDSTKITTFENLSANTVTTVNSTIAEIVTKHDLVANEVSGFGGFTGFEQLLAIRAGVLA